jgi:hypothetical protein
MLPTSLNPYTSMTYVQLAANETGMGDMPADLPPNEPAVSDSKNHDRGLALPIDNRNLCAINRTPSLISLSDRILTLDFETP